MLLDINISLYIVSAIGAFVLYFTMQAKGNITVEILAFINPNWKESPWCRFFESIIFSLLGSFIAVLLTQPSNYQQAIAAGLGWTGLLNGAINRKGL